MDVLTAVFDISAWLYYRTLADHLVGISEAFETGCLWHHLARRPRARPCRVDPARSGRPVRPLFWALPAHGRRANFGCPASVLLGSRDLLSLSSPSFPCSNFVTLPPPPPLPSLHKIRPRWAWVVRARSGTSYRPLGHKATHPAVPPQACAKKSGPAWPLLRRLPTWPLKSVPNVGPSWEHVALQHLLATLRSAERQRVAYYTLQ